MSFNFTKGMQAASDEELITITTTERSNYQEAAIKAAEIELASRNLTPLQIAKAVEKNEAIEEARIKKANMPLDDHWKALTFLFPGFIQLLVSGTFKGEGYDRKARELVKWTLYGFCFYCFVILITLVT